MYNRHGENKHPLCQCVTTEAVLTCSENRHIEGGARPFFSDAPLAVDDELDLLRETGSHFFPPRCP